MKSTPSSLNATWEFQKARDPSVDPHQHDAYEKGPPIQLPPSFQHKTLKGTGTQNPTLYTLSPKPQALAPETYINFKP